VVACPVLEVIIGNLRCRRVGHMQDWVIHLTANSQA